PRCGAAGETAPMTQQALDDVVVLEIAGGVAGAYCGRLFRDLGARVVKVEPAGGDPLRSAPPVHNGESAFFAYLNAGKLSVEIVAEDERLDTLVRRADIVLHDLRGADADALEERISAANPRAV